VTGGLGHDDETPGRGVGDDLADIGRGARNRDEAGVLVSAGVQRGRPVRVLLGTGREQQSWMRHVRSSSQMWAGVPAARGPSVMIVPAR